MKKNRKRKEEKKKRRKEEKNLDELWILMVQQPAQGGEEIRPIDEAPGADRGNHGTNGGTDQRLGITESSDTALLDVALDIRVNRVEVGADVVLEEKASHGPHSLIFPLETCEDVDEVIVVLSDRIKAVQFL